MGGDRKIKHKFELTLTESEAIEYQYMGHKFGGSDPCLRGSGKKCITCFGKTHKRAHLQTDIAGLCIEDSVTRIQDAVQSYVSVKSS